MMKQLLSTLCLFMLPFFASAQIENPVTWTFSAKKINANTYELHMMALIDAGWHIYSQETREGSSPTSFTLAKKPLITPVGKVIEVGALKKMHDKNLNTELSFYEKQVDLIQKVVVKGKAITKVKGTVEFTSCDDHQCLPPKILEFTTSVGQK